MILMIHEVTSDMLNVEADVLTYDDGLLSQYEQHSDMRGDKIFFICPTFIKDGHNDIGQKAMSLDNIKDLIADGHTIGCHSYYHTKIWELPSLNRQVVHLKTDTELMLKWFKDELNITPYHYAIPYEQDLDGMYQMILSKYDFKFYGMGRVNIDDILV